MTREIEWDDWQRSLALAYTDLEASIDPQTGVPLWDAENPTAIDSDGEFHWVADPVPNFARAALDRMKREATEAAKDNPSSLDGVSYRVRKVLARTD